MKALAASLKTLAGDTASVSPTRSPCCIPPSTVAQWLDRRSVLLLAFIEAVGVVDG